MFIFFDSQRKPDIESIQLEVQTSQYRDHPDAQEI
jgi:hypothetical protein